MPPILDVHVHICALTGPHGKTSNHLLSTLPFRFMRWRLGMKGADETTERHLEQRLATDLGQTPELDAAVILAFDAVHNRDGHLIDEKTHLYVTNDYVIELSKRHPKMRFGASVHPYRKDAVQDLERCVRAGAVLLKWLPIVQDFNPIDPMCIPFYEALKHFNLPLLCHTGGETSLPNLDRATADPMLLRPALDRGVTVIMAHCGSRSKPSEVDFTPNFVRLANEYEHCYGDTSALNLPTRWYAYDQVLRDKVTRQKLVHGSDWPIFPMPPVKRLGIRASWDLMRDRNWIRRDVLTKRAMNEFDEEYWQRAAKVLRIVS